MDYVHEVVALVKHFVNFYARGSELAFEGVLNNCGDDLRVRLIADLKHVLPVDLTVEAR